MIVIRQQIKQKKEMKYPFATHQKKRRQAKVGIAVDIGTTTVAMKVVGLVDGNIIGSLSRTNEQTKLGADVMMRIMHAMSGRADTLHQMIVTQIEEMAEEILGRENKWVSSDICFSVVGNTTMCHLFLNQDVSKLAGAPFDGAYTGNYICRGEDIGMVTYRNSDILVLSNIQAHVGSDALAMIGVLQMQASDKRQIAIDLGTNAEIVLSDKGVLSVCSTAAGPAFEGKGVSCGMASKKGAVNGVRMAAKNGNIILEVLEDQVPRGISGTGLVDVLAQCRKCNILLEDGYLLTQQEARQNNVVEALAERLVERNGERAFLLYPESINQGIEKEVYITQSDIRNLQLAKGAIQAGVETILKAKGLALADMDEVLIAGVLGSCMRPGNAIDIGLFPDVTKEKLVFVGNAAGEGATKLLLCEEFAEDMEEIATKITHLELADVETFQGALLRAMKFAKWK